MNFVLTPVSRWREELKIHEFVTAEPRTQSLLLLGAQTKIMTLAKWSPRVKPWSPRAPIFLSWRPAALQFLAQSPGALNPFGTLTVSRKHSYYIS